MGIVRLLLALSVVVAHFGDIFGCRFVDSPVAVQSFYIISGFYMSLILNEKYIGVNNSYFLFITNRFMRLYPVYWLVLLGTIVVSIGTGLITSEHSFPTFNSFQSVETNIGSFAFLALTNLFVFGQDVVMFLGIRPENGQLFFTPDFWHTHPPLHSFLFIPQAWTLGLELTFYLVAPFILRKGWKIVLPLIILSFALRLFIYNYFGLREDPWTYRFFPTEIMFFLLGYLSYRLQLRWKNNFVNSYFNLSVLLFVIVFTMGYSYLPWVKLTRFPFSIKELLFFLTIILAAPLFFNFFKKNRLDNKIGELSYPVYISHMFIGMICYGFGNFRPATFGFLKEGWIVAFLTIILSYFLNKIVAIPIEKYRQSRLKTATVRS